MGQAMLLIPKDCPTYENRANSEEAYRNTGLFYDDGFEPKITILNRGNFAIPGKGQQPDYCHTPFISHLKGDGTGAREIIISCKLSRCPSCYRLWIDQKVFDYAVKVEAYAQLTGSRPARGVSSLHPDDIVDITLQDIRNFHRNTNDRVKRCDVDAGVKVFHAFRIKKAVQDALRTILGGEINSSGAFWDALSIPGRVDEINDILGTDYVNWRDCVNLSPHIHMLLFPGDQKFTGDKKIMLKKLSSKINGKKVWTLDDERDVVKHLRYLIGHCGILVNSGKFRNEPLNSFGDMWQFKPEEHLTEKELDDIRCSILSVLNEGRSTTLLYTPEGNLLFDHDDSDIEDEEIDNYIPLREYIAYGDVQQESVDAWVSSITDPDCMHYVEYLLERYRDILDSDIPSKMKRLYSADLRDPPDSFKIKASFVGDR